MRGDRLYLQTITDMCKTEPQKPERENLSDVIASRIFFDKISKLLLTRKNKNEA